MNTMTAVGVVLMLVGLLGTLYLQIWHKPKPPVEDETAKHDVDPLLVARGVVEARRQAQEAVLLSYEQQMEIWAAAVAYVKENASAFMSLGVIFDHDGLSTLTAAYGNRERAATISPEYYEFFRIRRDIGDVYKYCWFPDAMTNEQIAKVIVARLVEEVMK